MTIHEVIRLLEEINSKVDILLRGIDLSEEDATVLQMKKEVEESTKEVLKAESKIPPAEPKPSTQGEK